MSPNTPPGTPPPPLPAVPPAGPKKSRWLLYGCGTILALCLLVVLTVVITVWWIQRPIKPVVLSSREKAAVEEKLRHVGGEPAPAQATTPTPNRSSGTDLVELPGVAIPSPEALQPPGRYTPGAKVIKLTEHEINGLLNANTDLGKSVRLEFDQDAINAYVVVPIPQDFPVAGGKMFRARGRFRVSVGNGGAPYAILDDVSVFGLSLPKAWLGGLKGQNLLSEAAGQRNGKPILQGIKSLRVEPGALVLEVAD